MNDDQQASRDVFTPSSLNRLVRDLLGDALPPLRVEGEISNLARPASGHLYFALKDAHAQLRCALFRPQAMRLGFEPANGSQVLVRGRISLYEARGDYQLIAESMEPAGEGALRREFERLKARLQAEGLFANERKQALPRWPRRIGILSSPSGAAVRDVISVIRRRLPLVEVELLPVPVQGKEAPGAIRTMLARAQQAGRHDVLVLARGGGSLEDLWAFNDEALARLIAASPVPIVSAIGHEVDFTLADFVADVRAATPSVAGELLVPDRRALLPHLHQLHSRILGVATRRLQTAGQLLDHAELRLRSQQPAARLARGRERLAVLHQRLGRSLSLAQLHARLDAFRSRLDPRRLQREVEQRRRAGITQVRRLRTGTVRQTGQARLQVLTLQRALNAVSPLATLERGYAIVRDAAGNAVRSTTQVGLGEVIDIRLADGSLQARRTDR